MNGLTEPPILVVDDNRASRLLMTVQLQRLGHAARVVGGGEEALAVWRSGGVTLVFTDLQMPEMDGYALTEAIRREEGAGSRTSIVALTASAPHESSKRWKAAGIDAWLTKPAELAALQAMLGCWLAPADERELPAVADEPSAAAGRRPAGEAPVALHVLAGMIGDDESALLAFLADFDRSAAESASAMEAELRLGHPQKVGFIAHRLKASARSVGSFRLGELCAALEEAGARADGVALRASWMLFRGELAVVRRWIALRLGTARVSQED